MDREHLRVRSLRPDAKGNVILPPSVATDDQPSSNVDVDQLVKVVSALMKRVAVMESDIRSLRNAMSQSRNSDAR